MGDKEANKEDGAIEFSPNTNEKSDVNVKRSSKISKLTSSFRFSSKKKVKNVNDSDCHGNDDKGRRSKDRRRSRKERSGRSRSRSRTRSKSRSRSRRRELIEKSNVDSNKEVVASKEEDEPEPFLCGLTSCCY